MRHLSGLMSFTMLVSACALDEDALGDVEQEGNTLQGNTLQGNTLQGNTLQGDSHAGWVFPFAGWYNAGMRLSSAQVSGGRLAAKWDRTDPCSTNGGLSRECNWLGAGSASCSEGTIITVRAGACGSLFGTRESMVRACAAGKPCTADAALAASDAACVGTQNPSVTFTCPSTGKYFVMVAPKSATSSFGSYSVATTPSATLDKWVQRGDLVGTTLLGVSGSTNIRFRITATAPATEGPELVSELYKLVDDRDGTSQLCSGDANNNLAIPFSGTWNETGHWHASSTEFTLGCPSGTLSKCYRVNSTTEVGGYRPWDVDASGQSLRDRHQSCTRAARADFCGNGTSFTINGTLIDVYDRAGHVTPAPSDGLTLESIWAADVRVEDELDDVPSPPTCLSKKRWDTLPYLPQESCPGIVDPRLYKLEGNPILSSVCDGRTANEWFASSTDNLIAIESAYNDAGLWRWRTTDGLEHRTTTLCTTQYPWTSCSLGYERDPSSDQPHFVGAVFNREIAPAALPPNTIPLYSFRSLSNGDYITTTSSSVGGYSARQLEGYIYDLSCEATATCPSKKLVLTAKGSDYLTTTSDSLVRGYATIRTLGYLPR